jgi:hypothetical protein
MPRQGVITTDRHLKSIAEQGTFEKDGKRPRESFQEKEKMYLLRCRVKKLSSSLYRMRVLKTGKPSHYSRYLSGEN